MSAQDPTEGLAAFDVPELNLALPHGSQGSAVGTEDYRTAAAAPERVTEALHVLRISDVPELDGRFRAPPATWLKTEASSHEFPVRAKGHGKHFFPVLVRD